MCQTTNQILGLYNSSNSPASVFFDVAECCIVVATRNVLGYWDPRQILYRNIGVYIYIYIYELCLGTPQTFDGLPVYHLKWTN